MQTFLIPHFKNLFNALVYFTMGALIPALRLTIPQKINSSPTWYMAPCLIVIREASTSPFSSSWFQYHLLESSLNQVMPFHRGLSWCFFSWKPTIHWCKKKSRTQWHQHLNFLLGQNIFFKACSKESNIRLLSQRLCWNCPCSTIVYINRIRIFLK